MLLLKEIAKKLREEIMLIIPEVWGVSATGRKGLDPILVVMCSEVARTKILAKYGSTYEGEEIHFQILDHPGSFSTPAA